MLECREALKRWGFTFPKGDIHRHVRLKFYTSKIVELEEIGVALDWLSQLRSKGDYDLTSRRFSNDADATKSVSMAEDTLSKLDAIDGDSARRAAAIADLNSRP